MSLRRRIILLFIGLAVVPLVTLGVVSYWQAYSLVREVQKDQLEEAAQAIAGALTTRVEEIEAALAKPEVSDVTSDPRLEPAVYIAWEGPGGDRRMLAGAAPSTTTRCREGGMSRVVTFSRDLPGPPEAGRLTAGYWTSDLLPSGGWGPGQEVLLTGGDGDLPLFASRCAGGGVQEQDGVSSAAVPSRLGADEGAVTRYGTDRESQVAARAPVSYGGWQVAVSAPPAQLAAPLRSMALAYAAFVLGLGLLTSLAFSILLGRFTRSLRELALAAEEIGMGELDPWLPLTTQGEIGQLTLAFNRMLARIRQMMAQVDQSGRLAVVGQLSAYLAHEIRNPLSSIKLNLQRLMRWTKNGSLPEHCLEPLEISLKEVERLNASVSGVLQLSRAQDSPREVVSLHQVVEEAADLLAARFRRQGVEVTLDLDAAADRVLARPGQLKSVILNLMVNALEAQPAGGRLEIRSALSTEPELGGPVVGLHFRDEGPGVPSEIRDRIFEPFFTTKSGGSGIGLAVASQAVRENGGEIHLEPSFSREQGAEFVVVFPLAALRPVGQRSWKRVAQSRRDRWGGTAGVEAPPSKGRRDVPPHLMTPEGLRAVLALSHSDPEEVN